MCDIGVVALLNILVGAFQDGVLLESLHSFFLLNAAEASFRIILAGAEVDSSLHFNSILTTTSGFIASVPSLSWGSMVSQRQGNNSQ